MLARVRRGDIFVPRRFFRRKKWKWKQVVFFFVNTLSHLGFLKLQEAEVSRVKLHLGGFL